MDQKKIAKVIDSVFMNQYYSAKFGRYVELVEEYQTGPLSIDHYS